MVAYCSASTCTASSDVFPGLRFHRFPIKNPELLQKWLVAIKRTDFKPSIYSRICSSHFTVADYDPPVICGPPRLKKTAVPSVFDYPDDFMLERNNLQLSIDNGICNLPTLSDLIPPMVSNPSRLETDAVPPSVDSQNNSVPKRTVGRSRRVLLASAYENREEPPPEPPEEVTKKSCTVATQTTLTGKMLLYKFNNLRREKRILQQRIKRRQRQLDNLREILISLKEDEIDP